MNPGLNGNNTSSRKIYLIPDAEPALDPKQIARQIITKGRYRCSVISRIG
jgi:hypothetical protein